jgi:outer membrane protein assembly factor BamB
MRLHVALTTYLLLSAFAVQAADWTHWRGPEQNGISREKNLVSEWSLNPQKNVLWTSPIGGRATPILLNGKVYLNCRTHHDLNDPKERVHLREQLVCWDAATGNLDWRDEFNVFQTDVPAPRVGWASMTGDPETGNVYLHSVSGLFRCYSGDGKLLWEHSLFEEYGRISGYGGRTVTPMVDEDRVIVGFMTMNWGDQKTPPPKERFYAFDKRTGALLWTSAPGGRPLDTTYSNPMVTVIDGMRMLICGNSDGGIHAIHARTGQPLWGFQMSLRGLNVSPVTDGKYVYIAHGEDNADNGEFGRIQCIDGTGRGDVTKTHSVWRVDGIKAGYASLLVHEGILYVVSDSGILHAFDSQKGEQLWTHKLGTVGKGSPVWADGKLYVMEVNGNIHILRPSRTGCESLSHVELMAVNGQGTDEIYASPAIADGRIVLVTRDRTICLGQPDTEPSSDPIPPLPAEHEPEDAIALIQLVPQEVMLRAGESADYELRAFDKNGRLLGTSAPQLEAGDGLTKIQIDGVTVAAPTDAPEQGGLVVAKMGELSATARVRVFPALPWKWDFTGYKERDVPVTWVGAFTDLRPMEIDGQTALYNLGGAGRPSTYIWLGPPDMKGYAVQADIRLRELKRRLSSAGITVQRYNLILKGNTQKLAVSSWPPHIRMDKEISFRSDPDAWYRMKLRVDPVDGGCQVRGKVWLADQSEPEAWTIEAFDPHPNENGSPGIYIFGLAETFFDNVTVFEEKE